MKKFLTLLALATISLASCKKDESIDHNPFIGNWEIFTTDIYMDNVFDTSYAIYNGIYVFTDCPINTNDFCHSLKKSHISDEIGSPIQYKIFNNSTEFILIEGDSLAQVIISGKIDKITDSELHIASESTLIATDSLGNAFPYIQKAVRKYRKL